MDNSLGKHVTCVVVFLAAIAVLMASTANVRADVAKPQSVGRTVRLMQHEEDSLPAVDLPAAELEGMVEIPSGELPAEIPLPVLPVEDPAFAAGADDGMFSDADGMVENYDSDFGVIPSWGEAGPAPVYSTGSWFSAGRWYTQLDAVVFTKDNRHHRRIAADSSSPLSRRLQFETTMWSRKERFDHQIGTRATIGRFLGRDAANRDHMWEFTYFGGFDWQSRSAIAAPSAIQTLLTVSNDFLAGDGASNFPGFNNNDSQTYQYDSEMNSFELNYRVKTRPGRDQMALHPSGVWTRHKSSGQIRSVLAGARAMAIKEAFLNEAFSGDFLTGQYRVRVDNYLFGPQVGVEVIELHDQWHLGFRGYFGALANFADRRSFLFSEVDGDVVNERVQKLTENQLTFFSQAGLYGACHLRPNLSVRAGYDVIFMSGLGIATDNLFIGDEFPGFSTAGIALYHGLSVGFEQTW